MQKKTKSNKQFMVLSVIAIIIMVTCHVAGDIYKIFSIFPFIAVFIFISGYFYQEKNEEKMKDYIFHKFKKLMIPFFILNLIYGIIVNILKHYDIVHYGSEISLYTMIIQPFINNSQYVFTFPSWFVPSLFIGSICYLVIHKFARKVKFINDEILLVVFSIIALITMYYSEIAREQSYAMVLFKIAFFLPFFQIGYLYKQKWQKYDDKIPTIPYLIVLIIVNYLLFHLFGSLNYDMHEFSGFEKETVVWAFIVSITSILFYTRIARVISKWIGENKIVNYISNHTFSIMTHHIFILFLFEAILYVLVLNGINIVNFDINSFKQGWIYVYQIPNWQIAFQLWYAIIGIVGPLILQFGYDFIKEKTIEIERKLIAKRN